LCDEAREDDVRVVVLIIPLHKPLLVSPWTDQLVGLLRNDDVVVVDLRQRVYGKPPELYHHTEDDWHWNENGHRLAAEELSRLPIYSAAE
jgi:hypothetical protein